MTSRTWIGGGNNSAANPNDWSPNGGPQPGDTLTVPFTTPGATETINVSGNQLAGDPLTINSGASATVNMSHGAAATVNCFLGTGTVNMWQNSTLNLDVGGGVMLADGTANLAGTDTLFLTDNGDATVNLAANAAWIGNIDAAENPGATVQVNGGAGSRFINETSTVHHNGAAVIDTSVVGRGSFTIGSAARLEFGGYVGSGESVALTANEPLGPSPAPAKLQIDQPAQFHGSVSLASGEIDLAGLAGADSYSFQNDMLSIFSNGNVIDTLRMADASQYGFVVENTSAGVSVLTITDPAHPPPGLPVHS